MDSRPLGILDSGIGGLSVLLQIQQQLPHENLIFVADQAHLPYGEKSLVEVRQFTEAITRSLLRQGAKLIVIACNTASAAALHYLRQTFPEVPFVGLEPAVRPAAQNTSQGTIGVIATQATFQGELYASLLERYAQGVKVVARACPELVVLAERGAPWTKTDYDMVYDLLADIRAAGADQLVLGCTHFPFLSPLLQTAMGEHVQIIDPAPAVARQVGRMLAQLDAFNPQTALGSVQYLTTGDHEIFQRQLETLLGKQVTSHQNIINDT